MKPPQNVSEAVRRLNPSLYGVGLAKIAPTPVSGSRKRIRQSSRVMNQLESIFFELLKQKYFPSTVYYEPMRMRLCNGVVYLADFMVVDSSNKVIFYEVKGNQQIQDDASVKIKMAAQQYPCFRFVLVWRDYGEWREQEILA